MKNRCGDAQKCDRCWIKDKDKGCPYTPNFVAREVKRIAESKARYMMEIVGKAFVEAAEKQIPMPVKIKTSLEGDFSGWWNTDGTYHVSVHYNAYCQNCGEKVDYGVKGMGAGFEHSEEEQYCKFCGQKLWWPKN